MRILITGFVVFVIWSLFSVRLYVDKLKPAMNKPVPVQINPETRTSEADSMMQLNALMPKDLMIYFEFDNTKFKTEPRTDSSIIEFKTWLDKYSESMLTITGHTDFVGTADYNNALGLKRALVVQQYLESKGIAANKMITNSKGKDQPAASQITKEGRAKSRRTVITIKK
jgi:outer membrane protein OmpA-like peptidoglycan-associated protein